MTGPGSPLDRLRKLAEDQHAQQSPLDKLRSLADSSEVASTPEGAHVPQQDDSSMAPPVQPHETVLPAPQTGDAFDLAATAPPKAPRAAAAPPAPVVTAPADVAYAKPLAQRAKDTPIGAKTKAFLEAAVPGALVKAAEDDGTGQPQQAAAPAPDVVHKRGVVGSFHQMPGASPFPKDDTESDRIKAAGEVGSTIKQAAYFMLGGKLSTEVGNVLSQIGPQISAVPYIAPLARMIAQRTGWAEPAVAGRLAALVEKGIHGAPEGVAFDLMVNAAEGTKPTPEGAAKMGVIGAALSGAHGMVTAEPLSLSQAVSSPIDVARQGHADPYVTLGAHPEMSDADINKAWKQRVVDVRNSGVPDAENIEAKFNAARSAIRQQRAAMRPVDRPADDTAEPDTNVGGTPPEAAAADEATAKAQAKQKEDVAKAADEPKPSIREKVADIIDPSRKQKLSELEDERRAAVRASETDDLTGLGNMAAFQKARATAESDPGTAFITFDANNFKTINDTHGHSAGNAVLQHFSAVLQRMSPRAFRTGGDEFVILAPADQAEAVRDAVEKASAGNLRGVNTSLTGTIGLSYDEADQQLKARKDAFKGKATPAPEEVSAPDAGVAEHVQQGVKNAIEPAMSQEPVPVEPPLATEPPAAEPVAAPVEPPAPAPVEPSAAAAPTEEQPVSFAHHTPRPEFIEHNGEDAVADPDASFAEIAGHHNASIEYSDRAAATRSPKKAQELRDQSKLSRLQRNNMLEEYENQYGEEAADEMRSELKLTTKAAARASDEERRVHDENDKEEDAKETPAHPFLERTGKVTQGKGGYSHAPYKDITKAGVYKMVRRHVEPLRKMITDGASNTDILEFLGDKWGEGGSSIDGGFVDHSPGKNPKVTVNDYDTNTKTVLRGKPLAELVRESVAPDVTRETPAPVEAKAEPKAPAVPTADKPMELPNGGKAYKEGDTWHVWSASKGDYVPFRKGEMFDAMEKRAAELPAEAPAEKAESDATAPDMVATSEAAKWADPNVPIEKLKQEDRSYIDNLKKDIEKNGIQHPIEVSANRTGRRVIEDGMHRLVAAQELGITDIPVNVTKAPPSREKQPPKEEPKEEEPKAEEPKAEPKQEEPAKEKQSRLKDAADAARERIKARGKRLLSGIDPEEFADYVIIGADKMVDGVRDLAKWMDEMAAEFGEGIRAHLGRIRNAAVRLLETGAAPESMDEALAKEAHEQWQTVKEYADVTGAKTDLETAPEEKAVAPEAPAEDTTPNPMQAAAEKMAEAAQKMADAADRMTGAKPAGDISTDLRPGESKNVGDKAETASDTAPAVEADRSGAPESGGSAAVRGAPEDGGAGDQAGRTGEPGTNVVREPGESDSVSESGTAGGVGPAKRAGKRNPRRTDTERIVDSEPTPAEDAGKVRGENYRIQPTDLEDLGGPKGRANQNLEAIRIAKQLTKEGRPATLEEQQKLVRFVGWGGLSDIFPTSGYVERAYRSNYVKPEWEVLSKQLKELLTKEEYATAERSTQYAHYTSPEVIQGMYDALKHLGVSGSIAALEPGAGIGHFIGLSPFEARFTAVEMDHLSAEILGHLYPHANLITAPYQKVVLPDNSVDVAIGNPPFKGGKGIEDRKYGKTPLKLHDYFFVKSLDKVRPGGLLAFVTSTGTMDKAGRGARQFMADRADFLGAIRLPGDAFKKNAATEVTTDIIFMRKRFPGEATNHVAPWMKQGEISTVQGARYPVNEYFVDHPDMVLGEWVRDKLSMDATARAGVKARSGEDIGDAIRKAIEALPADQYAPQGPAKKGAPTGDAPKDAKSGQWVIKRGKITQVVDGSLVDTGIDPKSKVGIRVRELVDLGDAARAVINANTDNASDADLAKAQKAMTKLYDAFVEKYGPINKVVKAESAKGTAVITRPNLQRYNDPVNGPLVQSIERYDPETGSATKTPIHSKRLFEPPVIVDKVDTAWRAVVASLVNSGRVDMDYVRKLYDKSEAEILNELGDQVFVEPMSGHYQPAQQYLSGNVKEKLSIARSMAEGDPSLQKNIAALEKVQPKDVTPKQMREQGASGIGATWITPETYRDFAQDVFGMSNAKITYRELDGSYGADKGGIRSLAKYQQWGTTDVDAIDLYRDMLNGRQTTVWVKDSDGKRHVDAAATELAQKKQQEIQRRFDQWVYDDHDARTDELVQRYNDLMNNTVVAQWDGAHLAGNMPGMAVEFRGKPLKLAPHQLNVIWQYLTNGNTLVAHEVGAGKTMAMIAMGMEAKRMGLVKKPMYVVPNSMIGQFSRELIELYPGAKIQVADDYNFEASRRREFSARVASDDWDAVILSHSALKLIPNDPKFAQEITQAILAEYEEALEHAKEEGEDRHTVKGLQNAVESYQEQLDALMDIQNQDNVVYFQQLGVDMMVVDEAHEFKNLPLPSTTKGINFTKAQKTVDLYVKTRHIERVNPNRGLVFATATPVSNSIAEMYTMMRYLMEADLAKRGYRSFDAWAHDHVASWQEDEFTAIGTVKPVFRPRAYRNTFAMAQMFRSVADVKTRADLNLPTPPLIGGKPQEIIIPGSKRLRQFMKSLQDRWDNRPPRPAKGDDGVFPIMNDGRFGSIDAQLVTSRHAAAAGHDAKRPWDHTKAEAAAKQAFDIWQDTKALRGTQMIFSDLAVPKDLRAADADALREQLRKDPDLTALDDKEIDHLVEELTGGQSPYDIYNDIKDRLVKMGVPANEIEFIQSGKNKAARQAIIDRVKAGQTRILIGSTPMMGQGVNAQDRMVALHHLDVPYKPAWLDQRDGRIVRQGNLLYDNMENGVPKPLIDGVRIYRYILKGSYDPKAWQILENKIGFIHQAMTARADTGMVEEVGGDATITPKDAYAIIKAEGSENPYAMDFAHARAKVKSLELEKAEYGDMEFRRRQSVGHLQGKVQQMQLQIRDAEKDAAKIPDLSGDKFTIKIGDTDYTDRTAAGPQLLARIRALQAVWDKHIMGQKDEKIAEFAGLPLHLDYLPWHRQKYTWSLRGIQSYSGTPNLEAGTSGTGLVASLENLLDKIRHAPDDTRKLIAQTNKEIEDIKDQLGKPFPKADELEQAKETFKDLDKKMREFKPADEEPLERRPEEAVEHDDEEDDGDDEGDMGSPRQYNRTITPDRLPDAERWQRPADPVTEDGVERNDAITSTDDWFNIERPEEPPPVAGEPVSAPQVMHQLARVTAAAYRAVEKFGPLRDKQIRGGDGTKTVPFRVGRLPRWALGVWKTHDHVIRTRTANSISTGAHEVGHAIETIIYGWPKGSPWKGTMISGAGAKELVKMGKALYGDRKPVGGYKREGFAEYIRKRITGVDQSGRRLENAAKDAPEFNKWFEGTFLVNNPEVAKELDAAGKIARQWYGQGAKARALMSIAEKSWLDLQKEKVEKVKKFLSKAEQMESAQPVYDLVMDAQRSTGMPLKPIDDPYLSTAALRLTHTARAAYMVNNGMIDLAGNLVGPPLTQIRSLVQGQSKDFMVYLWARRTISLHEDPVGRAIARKNGRRFEPRNSGLSIDDARELFKDYHTPQFEQAADMVYEWNRGVRQYAAQASPMFRAINEAIEARDPGNYVPLKREFDQLEGMWNSSGASKNSFTKKLNGSGRRVLNMFEAMITQAEQTIRAAHQRVVIEQIVKLANIPGVGDLIEKVDPDMVPVASRSVGDLVEQINRKVQAKYDDAPILKFDTSDGVPMDSNIAEEMVTFFAQPYSPKPGQLIVPIKTAAGVDWYQVNEPLYKSLMGMDVYRLPAVMDVLFGKPVRVLRAGTTGLRASFGLVWNTMRDVQTFMVNSQGDNAPKLLGMWAVGMKDSFAHQLGMGTSDSMDRYLRLGGNMAQSLGQDMSHTRRAARQLFQGRMIRTLDPRNLFDFYREVISSPEAAPRVAEMEAVARQVGWAPGQPMTLDQSWQILLAGKQVTTDFTAAGNFARVMNQVIPFYNSSIQGPRATARAFRRSPSKVMGRGLALAIAALALYWKHKDEDWYRDMQWVDRFTNWHFPFEMNGRKYLLRIPRAFDIGLVFSAMPEAFLDSWYRKDPEAAKQWFLVFEKAMNPLGLPPVMGEAADQLANKDLYFDTPIVPGGDLEKPNPEQYNEYTSRMAIRLGEILNVSPRRLDHAIKGLAGPAAGDVIKWLGLGPAGVGRETELADLPLLGRAFPRGGQTGGSGSIAVDRLFDQLDKARKTMHSEKAPETYEQKQARLILEDAAKAVAAASFVRTRTPSFAARADMSAEIRTVARDAIDAYNAALNGAEADRGEFSDARKEFKFKSDSTKAVLKGKRIPPHRRSATPRARRPRTDEMDSDSID